MAGQRKAATVRKRVAPARARARARARRPDPDLEAIRPLAVTVEQAAIMVGVCRATMYKAVMSREIESFTVGRARRIPVAAIEALMGVGIPSDRRQIA